MSGFETEFYLPRAEWLVHQVVPMYLDAVGYESESSFFRESPVVTEKALISGRVMFGKLKKVREINKDLMYLGMKEHNALPDDVRKLWRGTMYCSPEDLRVELVWSRIGFGRSRMGWELKGIVDQCSSLLLIRNNWKMSDYILSLSDRALNLLVEHA